jgi:hypothetical protein
VSPAEQRFSREYRAMPARVWSLTVLYTVASAGLVLRMAWGGVPPVATIAVAVFFAALLVWMFLALRGGATIVDERAMTLRRPRMYGGDLVFPWPEIQGIETQMNQAAGTRSALRVLVVVYDSKGRRHILPHVHDRNGLNVVQEVATLRGLWTLGRGENWVRHPDVAAKITYTRKHPLMLPIVALMAAVAAFLVGILVFFIVLIGGGYANGGATLVTPPYLLGVFPGSVYVITLVVVGLRRRAERKRG